MCAQEAHARLGLESVRLVPVGEAPHRELAQDPGGEVRVRLCELATASDPRLGVSRLEVDRPGPSYTVDTLRLLREQEPAEEPVLILGADQASRLGSWRDPGTVLELARVGVATRGGVQRDQVVEALDGLSVEGRLEFFDMPRIDVSSSLVRERAGAGLPIRYLVPDAVADEMAAEGLYGTAARAVAE
jgi:nicotinate-nucleotide adenylyltransferase